MFELNEDTIEILGKPNFTCGPIAQLLRDATGAAIPRKAEVEQAHVIHWLLGLYEMHGALWCEEAQKQIDAWVENLMARENVKR